MESAALLLSCMLGLEEHASQNLQLMSSSECITTDLQIASRRHCTGTLSGQCIAVLPVLILDSFLC